MRAAICIIAGVIGLLLGFAIYIVVGSLLYRDCGGFMNSISSQSNSSSTADCSSKIRWLRLLLIAVPAATIYAALRFTERSR